MDAFCRSRWRSSRSTPWMPAVGGGRVRARSGRHRRRGRSRTWRSRCSPRRRPGIGMLIYSAFIWHLTGDPLAWAEGHAAWGRQYSGLRAARRKVLRLHGRVRSVHLYRRAAVRDAERAGRDLCDCGRVSGVARASAWPTRSSFSSTSCRRWRRAAFSRPDASQRCCFRHSSGSPRSCRARHRPAWLGSFMAFQALNAALFYTWHEMF